MTFVKISGIKVVRANGAVYRYHRAAGRRLTTAPTTQPEAFFAEVKLLEAKAAEKTAAKRDGRKVGNKLVLNRLGKPYTKDGLDSSFDRIKRNLVKKGKIRPGLTFHGLRKSLGKAAADAGFSENDIAGALGQANPASARVYTQEAARNQGALRVFKALSKRR